MTQVRSLPPIHVAILSLTILGLLAGCARFTGPADPGSDKSGAIRVLSFNIWVGGEGGKLPLEQTARVIQASGADIVGIQEANGREQDGVKPDNGRKIADMLQWNYVAQDGGKAIMSRFEIGELTPARQGAKIQLPSGDVIHFFNVHLYHAPYQPYQLLGIPYEDAPFLDNADDLIEAAETARGEELREALREIAPLVAAGELVVLTGDFNEPSHLDWTDRAVMGGAVPLAVDYPASNAATASGLIDVYRRLHPNEVTDRGHTWTPVTREDDPADRHDRIDFVYASPNFRLVRCDITGESNAYGDIVVTPYPSDHRGVAATLGTPPGR